MVSTRTMVVCVVACLMAGQARADDRQALIFGPGAKAWAGAGTSTTRGAEALQYNPAAVGVPAKSTLQIELSYLSLSYDYRYSDTYDAVEINEQSPIPFLAYSHYLNKNWTAGVFFVPLPASNDGIRVEGVPTRKLSADPLLVDILQTNPSMGWVGGLGAAYRFDQNWRLGWSLLSRRSDSMRQVFDQETGIQLQEQRRKFDDLRLNVGLRWAHKASNIGLSSQVASRRIENIEQSELSLEPASDQETLQNRLNLPQNLSLGAYHRWDNLVLMADLRYIRWSRVYDLEQNDVFDSIDLVGGFGYWVQSNILVHASYGFYPGNQGDGLIADNSPSRREISGFEVGAYEAMSRQVYALALRWHVSDDYLLQSFIHQQRSRREVFEYGVARGQHQLTLSYAGVSMEWGL